MTWRHEQGARCKSYFVIANHQNSINISSRKILQDGQYWDLKFPTVQNILTCWLQQPSLLSAVISPAGGGPRCTDTIDSHWCNYIVNSAHSALTQSCLPLTSAALQHCRGWPHSLQTYSGWIYALLDLQRGLITNYIWTHTGHRAAPPQPGENINISFFKNCQKYVQITNCITYITFA